MSKEISSHAGAAKMIRQFMKANGIAGSVISKSYSMGSSISVYVEDLPPAQYQVLKDYVSQFEYGHFDGMQDLYEMSNCRDDIPQVKYAFVNNKISDELYQDIWDFLKSYYSGMENAPADAKEAGSFYYSNGNQYGNNMIYRFFNGGYCQMAYWDKVNGVVQEPEVA